MRLVLVPKQQSKGTTVDTKPRLQPFVMYAEAAYACWLNVDLELQAAFIAEILKFVESDITHLPSGDRSDLLSKLDGYLQQFLPIVTASKQDVDFFVSRSVELFKEYYLCLAGSLEESRLDTYVSWRSRT